VEKIQVRNMEGGAFNVQLGDVVLAGYYDEPQPGYSHFYYDGR